MQGESNGQNGQEPWEDRDEFCRLMDSLGQEELRRMLERLNAPSSSTRMTRYRVTTGGSPWPSWATWATWATWPGQSRISTRQSAWIPATPIPHYNRGLAHAGLGDPCRAVEDLSRAIELEPLSNLSRH